MVKLVPVFLFYFFAGFMGMAQQPQLYKDSVFSTVTVQRDGSYRLPAPEGKKGKAYRFDLYQPEAASTGAAASPEVTRPARPLIIWMHGGGFKFGSKSAQGCKFWCTSFARRGYLCASINYRLSHKNALFHFKDLVAGAYDAVADAREAVAFFKSHYKEYHIDTNRIILGGNSAGGIIALQAAYSQPQQMLALAGDRAEGLTDPASAGRPGGIAAVINFWGALFSVNWLSQAKVPIVSVHGGRDHIVPADRKGASFFGSLSIHAKADSLSIPNRIKIYEGYSHELEKHFNPFFVSRATRRRWQEAGQFAADFLYAQLY